MERAASAWALACLVTVLAGAPAEAAALAPARSPAGIRATATPEPEPAAHHVAPPAPRATAAPTPTAHPTAADPRPYATASPRLRPTPRPANSAPATVHRSAPAGTGSTPQPAPSGYDEAAYDGWREYLDAESARERLQSLKASREQEAVEIDAARAEAAAAAGDAGGAQAARDALFGRLAAAEADLAAAQTDLHRIDAAEAAARRQLAFAQRAQRPGLLEAAAGGLQSLLESFRYAGLDPRRLGERLAGLEVARLRVTALRTGAFDQVAVAAARLDGSGGAVAAATDRRDAAVQRAAAAEAEVARLDAEIARAREGAWAQALAAGSPEGATLSPGHSTQYRFIWPEPGAWISQGWGPSTLLGEPSFLGYAHFHTGVDLAAPAGTIVYAADDGIVAVASEGGYSGYGNFVILNHAGGVSSLYGHLKAILVEPGQAVHQGQPIGLEGSTGYSTGPHLHFETRIDGTWVNPLPFLPPGAPSNYRR